MKEHGLQLSDPMARARHARLKTQTRRVIGPTNTMVNGGRTGAAYWKALKFDLASAWVDPGPSPAGNPGPYLKAPATGKGYQDTTHRLYPRIWNGDRIWWRECHKVMDTDSLLAYPELNDGRPVDERDCNEEEYHISIPIYRATDMEISLSYNGDEKAVPWTPSQFMRRKWARFVDTVVAVRPERLFDITDADAIAEGIVQDSTGWCMWDQLARRNSPYDHLNNPHAPKKFPVYVTPRECFLGLIELLHGEKVVKQNPWLWVITVEHGVTEQA